MDELGHTIAHPFLPMRCRALAARCLLEPLRAHEPDGALWLAHDFGYKESDVAALKCELQSLFAPRHLTVSDVSIHVVASGEVDIASVGFVVDIAN